MSIVENKAVILRFFKEIANGGNLACAEEIVHRDIVFHEMSTVIQGYDAYVKGIGNTRAAIPDLHLTLEDLIAEADQVMVRFTWRFTHRAPFRGYPPTGRAVAVLGFTLYRVVAGKITEGWGCFDSLSMAQQLGASLVRPTLDPGAPQS